MKYLVMECHRGYAVVMDEEGRFLKAANLNYTVGQELNEIVAAPPVKKIPTIGVITRTLTVAACFCLIFLCSWQYVFTPTGTVRMQINPDVAIEVNALNYVIDIEGRNADGERLIDGVKTFGKKVDEVADELGNRAMTMGYLTEGGEISLTVQGESRRWNTATEARLQKELESYFGGTVTVTIVKTERQTTESQKITIPVSPQNENDDDDDNPEEYTDSKNDDDNTDDDDDNDDNDNDDSNDEDNDDDGEKK